MANHPTCDRPLTYTPRENAPMILATCTYHLAMLATLIALAVH